MTSYGHQNHSNRINYLASDVNFFGSKITHVDWLVLLKYLMTFTSTQICWQSFQCKDCTRNNSKSTMTFPNIQISRHRHKVSLKLTLRAQLDPLRILLLPQSLWNRESNKRETSNRKSWLDKAIEGILGVGRLFWDILEMLEFFQIQLEEEKSANVCIYITTYILTL